MKTYKIVLEIEVDENQILEAKKQTPSLLEYALELRNDSGPFGNCKITGVIEIGELEADES